MVTQGHDYLIEILSNQDQQICTYLEEKLHIYAELGELSGFQEVHLEPHLLIRPDPGEPPQAASLLAAALKEGEMLPKGLTPTNATKGSQASFLCHAPWLWAQYSHAKSLLSWNLYFIELLRKVAIRVQQLL